MPKSSKKKRRNTVIYGFGANRRMIYIGKTNNKARRDREHKNGCSSRIDRELQKRRWQDSTTLETIDPSREDEYVFNRERHNIKQYNTYFKGLNETPGGNTGYLKKNLIYFKQLKYLPIPGSPMTTAQHQFLKKLVEHRPLPPVLQVTIDLTGEERNVEEYEQERSEQICQLAWDKYRYHFADQLADSIQLGSFVYRNRSLL